MAFQNNSSQEVMSEINVTPLVDVMLVLLVVFIVTAPLLTQAIKVTLPKTVSTGPANPNPPQTVHITADGGVSLDATSLNDHDLAQNLSQQASSHADFELRLHADQHVPYGRVAEVMAIAQHAGVSKLSFITVQQ
ncbi:MAG: biopolymer transporter ExbD [Gallionella sp.]|nr:biopolymer transporter ExbD [Gallionella sp.]MDD4960161.1 biopolymer transporter ExbD [Gallionella sp.]